jgi:BolA protein
VKRTDLIRSRISEALDPLRIEIADESHLHAGHAGDRGGESHFRALVVSARFEGRTRVERQRLVYAALGDLFPSAIHALAMRTLTPEEWQREALGPEGQRPR